MFIKATVFTAMSGNTIFQITDESFDAMSNKDVFPCAV